MTRCGNAVVVREGPQRLLWHHRGGGTWIPCGLWPERRHREQLSAHLACGCPLLVVLDGAAAVPVLREEWQHAPEPLRAALGVAAEPGAEVVELTVPFLDWLPAEHRRRGADFLSRTDALLARRPAALLPPLLLDHGEPAPGQPRIRFARRRPSAVLTPGHLAAVVQQTFGRATACPAAAERAGARR
ncbi:hypothetical protein [Streptomyces luteireticuli]|uniref:hypothetical protein n=1 Tax=Streptomyces luteireticuli TaxID=173858 RepID=UPI003557F438